MLYPGIVDTFNYRGFCMHLERKEIISQSTYRTCRTGQVEELGPGRRCSATPQPRLSAKTQEEERDPLRGSQPLAYMTVIPQDVRVEDESSQA